MKRKNTAEKTEQWEKPQRCSHFSTSLSQSKGVVFTRLSRKNQEKSREGYFHMWVLTLNYYWVLQKNRNSASGLRLPVQTHNRHSQRSHWLLTTTSNQFILQSEWTFVPNVKKFPRGVPEISCSQQCKGWTGTCGQTEKSKTSPTRRHKNLMKDSYIPTCKLQYRTGSLHSYLLYNVKVFLSMLVLKHKHRVRHWSRFFRPRSLSEYVETMQSNSALLLTVTLMQ